MTLPNHLEQAKLEFHQALAEPYTIKMLVFGSGADIDAIYQKAQTRASANSARKVIRILDPKILTEEETVLYRQHNSANVICVLNLQGQPVEFLTQAQATHLTYIEKAFANAQQQSGK